MLTTTSNYDEALERFHRTGPEFDGSLSNHGPMVVEVLQRWGHEDAIQRWTDRYLTRLDELPRSSCPIEVDSWRDALGQPQRAADWIVFFQRELADQPWRALLVTWWPRLLPGIAAGATHGVIRLGHAAAALNMLETAPRLDELAHALGYWAARWQAVPLISPGGNRPARELITGLPRVADQNGGIRARLAQLDSTAGWAWDVATLGGPDDVTGVAACLAGIIDAVVMLYPRYARDNPTMLIHAATAPNAVLRTLPLLPHELWTDSLAAAWSASAAVVSAYAPTAPDTEPPAPADLDHAIEAALEHGGEHVIKFTDAALSVHTRTGDPTALSAALTAVRRNA
ncbi:MAG: questin oxidase family protein [Jatrophihabitantaceae bacterium]